MFAKRTHWGRRRLAGFWLRIIVIQARVGGRNTLRNEPIRGAGGWTVSGCESLLYGLGLVRGILCEPNPFGALAAGRFLAANHRCTGSGWCTEYFAKRTHSGHWRPAGFWLRIIVIRARVGARNTLRNEPIRGTGGQPVSGCESLLYGLGLVHGILCETNPFGALAASRFLVANHCYTGSGWCTEYFAKRTHSGRWRPAGFWLRIIVIRARLWGRALCE